MIDILIVWNDSPQKTKLEILTVVEFYNKFNIHQVIICNLEGWENFLQDSKLESSHVPDYEESGFNMDELIDLDRLGYIPDTECYSIDCYSFNGKVFASPYQDQIKHGEHVSNAFQKLLGAIEFNYNCEIFYR